MTLSSGGDREGAELAEDDGDDQGARRRADRRSRRISGDRESCRWRSPAAGRFPARSEMIHWMVLMMHAPPAVFFGSIWTTEIREPLDSDQSGPAVERSVYWLDELNRRSAMRAVAPRRSAATRHCWSRCCWRLPAAISTPTPGSRTAFSPTRRRPISCSCGCMPRPRDGSRPFTLCRRCSPSSSAWWSPRGCAGWPAAGPARSASLIEIGMLILVGILHNRVPQVAGTLGISMVAAMQTSIFTRVEGVGLQLGDDHGQFPPGDRGRIRSGLGRRTSGCCENPAFSWGFAPHSGRARLSAPS